MRLSELIQNGAPHAGAVAEDIEIRGLTSDSRQVEPGFLFAALTGSHARGTDYVPEAINRGAVAVLASDGAGLETTLGKARLVTDPNPRRRLALMAAQFFGRQPKVIAAVTGTNGKSSVAAFTRQIWQSDGRHGGSFGSLGVCANGITRALSLTTPDPILLHRLLKEIAEAGVDHLVLEASSHGLDQHRLDGVRIGAAAFLNLTRDHLDYHPSAEAYFAAKARLFGEVMADHGHAVLNADAPETAQLRAICRERGHDVLTFGTHRADVRLHAHRPDGAGQHLDIEVLGQRHEVVVPLPGVFQAMNMLAAVGLALSTGVEPEQAIAALAHLRRVHGRLEEAARHPNGAPIYVDYAHTPDALETVLRALRPYASGGRLAVVFGCGGDRDTGKRPQMGRLARALADVAYVTDDNPRSEDPKTIRRQIMAGCPGATEIGDRAEAIHTAVAALGPDDVLVIAGKGHEQGQTIGDRVVAFDDIEVARRAVAALTEGDR